MRPCSGIGLSDCKTDARSEPCGRGEKRCERWLAGRRAKELGVVASKKRDRLIPRAFYSLASRSGASEQLVNPIKRSPPRAKARKIPDNLRHG